MGKSSNFNLALKSFQEISKLEKENDNSILLIVPWLSRRGGKRDGERKGETKNGKRMSEGERLKVERAMRPKNRNLSQI